LQLVTGNDANGRLDLFTIGTDHRVYEMVGSLSGLPGFSHGPWTLIHAGSGDTTVSQIAVSINTSGRQEVFGINLTTHAVCHIEQTAANGGWGTWASLGGWVSQIALGSTTDGRLEVFAIGGEHAVWIMRQTSAGGWTHSSWVKLGGFVKQIAVAHNLDGREEVFAIGGDNTVWALAEASVNDAWTDSLWFQITNDPVQALAVVLNTNQGGSPVYGDLALALIQMNNSMTTVVQTNNNGGWY